MMKQILTMIIVALSVLPAFALTSGQSEDPIASIRQRYAQINAKAARYRKVKKELSGFSAEGGTLLAYLDGSSIMKIAATFYGETGRTNEEYYYSDDRLIFVLRSESTYSKPLSGKIVRTIENRFYFKDGQLIRWIDENGKQPAANTTEYADKQKEYLESSKQFAAGARSKNPTIESNQ
jgi:hypothetical protein